MSLDVLADAVWRCGSTEPGRLDDPRGVEGADLIWFPANVPGTVAGALWDAGSWRPGIDDESMLDGRDWWYRCEFDLSEPEGDWELRFNGLATLADVWLNGKHVLYSENMFRSHAVAVKDANARNQMLIRFAALKPALDRRHPRPRWKSRLVRSQSLRWYRTSLFGRGPAWSRWAAPVGPWRPVEMIRLGGKPVIRERELHVRREAGDGVVSVRALVRCPDGANAGALCVGDAHTSLELERIGEDLLATATLRLPDVRPWWPHTHGDPCRYPVSLQLDRIELDMGFVGFRTVELDRHGGAFTLSVNGAPIFCRGACWNSPDPVSLSPSRSETYEAVRMARDAGMNMLRVPAYMWYEDDAFWDACDELGVLVWQDCMIASTDPPEDPAFQAELEREMLEIFGRAQARPSLAIVCGSSEVYQQAAMLGLEQERWRSSILEQAIPTTLAESIPAVPYVPSSPSGGAMPFDPDSGVAHYFGVGAYMRPLVDARLANVRFAAECLAFGTPPEQETMREVSLDPRLVGHDPTWKSTVARDAGTSWDFEDIRDHYVREIFGLDPFEMRYSDPERALDLGRAAIVEAFTSVLSDWRRADSACAGAIVLTMRDQWPGAGWGLLDSRGRPKASWYAFARACAPVAALITDEGLSGIYVHVLNDRQDTLTCRLGLTVFDALGNALESAEREVVIDARGDLRIPAHALLGGFRDLNAAYRFGPEAYDVALVELRDADGERIAEVLRPLGGLARPRLASVGLRASAQPMGQPGVWRLAVVADAFAQHVALDVPGFVASDSWFHLAPGRSRALTLRCADPADTARVPAGSVRALNSRTAARILSHRQVDD